jgi:hypothetical protein
VRALFGTPIVEPNLFAVYVNHFLPIEKLFSLLTEARRDLKDLRNYRGYRNSSFAVEYPATAAS